MKKYRGWVMWAVTLAIVLASAPFLLSTALHVYDDKNKSKLIANCERDGGRLWEVLSSRGPTEAYVCVGGSGALLRKPK